MKKAKRAKARAKARLKTGGKARAKTNRAKLQASRTVLASDGSDALVTAGTKALGIPLDPAWLASVVFNLRLILSHAEKVEAFPLPDDAEPAPIFHA
jgi:Protein of unknown function (DUF4089)